MRRIVVGGAFVLVGIVVWRAVHVLSSDAIAMAIGMAFGVMVLVPSGLLLLASDYQRATEAQREPPALPASEYWLLDDGTVEVRRHRRLTATIE